MKFLKSWAGLFCLLLGVVNPLVNAAAKTGEESPDGIKAPLQVAFMPDIHFHDIYAEFRDGSFAGIPNSISGKNATIRTMQAQLTSTRLFNENYFALLAALDDVVERGVKLVALPGDFSDDGQPVHIRGLRQILEHYSKQHAIEFFAAPGNHDPVRPFDTPGGESDFLGPGGQEQRIFSKGARECTGYETPWATVNTDQPLKTICTQEISHLGYQSIMSELRDFGFFPKASYVYWETPYSQYQEYNLEEAALQSNFHNRQYEICHQGTGGEYKKPGYSNCHRVPDASYLVEPVPGLWLLAIDANVYVPKAEPDEPSMSFEGSGNAGYNKMLTHKRHVLDWIKDVVVRAEKSGKQLVAFSHFPMTEFYDGQSDAIAGLFGEGNFQLQRKPKEHVSQVLADTGLKLHVGGHMHMNDTGVVRSPDGNTLFNIQAPSLAAYVPAYKLMTIRGNGKVEVETVVLDEVPRFDELFEHYRQEYKARKKAGQPLWNKEILQSQNYREFTNWHIHELTRQRFLPGEWPEDLKQLLFAMNGRDMLVLSHLENTPDFEQSMRFQLEHLKAARQWRKAEKRAAQRAQQAGLDLAGFEQWNGFDLAVDFYRLRNAGGLARYDINGQRLAQYQLLTTSIARGAETGENPHALPAAFSGRLVQLFGILEAFRSGEADDHFMLDLNSGEIQPCGSGQTSDG